MCGLDHATVGFWYSREESNGSFLVISEYGKVFSLNATAMTILQGLTETHSIRETQQRLVEEFRIDTQTASTAVERMLPTLRITGILREPSVTAPVE